MIIWAAVGTIALAVAISALATPVSQRLARQWGIMDPPGLRKTHATPVPLLGGSAIFVAILIPSLLALSLARIWTASGVPDWIPDAIKPHISGAALKAPKALGILAGAFVLHVVGLIDDRRALGPWVKLAAQVMVAGGVVWLCDVRILTAVGGAVSFIVSLAWLIVIINAFNFLDNMDGLSASVAVICAVALLSASASMGQIFVSAWLCLIIGALLGFLPYNFPPARTYMGDAGSMLIGYFLGVVSCLTTYVSPGQTYYLYGIFVPLVLMAVPLYDMASVITLRIRERANPMIGDRRHFSHRLLRRGMSARTALLTICLCTAATAICASLLARVDAVGAVLLFAQTIAILLIIALLESPVKKV